MSAHESPVGCYQARREADGTFRMFKDGQPTVDRWAGPLAEESAKIYEAFWNTEYGAIVREHGYYEAIHKGLITPDGYGPLTITHVQLKDLDARSAERAEMLTQRTLWEDLA